MLVRNLQASLEFWRDRVGFSCERTYNDPPTFAMPYRDEVVIMLVQTPHGKEPPPPNWKIAGATNQVYIWVENIDALYAEVQDRGAHIDFTLYDTPWGTREFGVQCPDGYDIAFGEVLIST